MKKSLTFLLLISFYAVFTSCNNTTPEEYFDIAVLNCNLIHGFAGRGLQSELESPSVKLVEGSKDQTESMKRKEIIDIKIQALEPALEKIRRLKQTDETKDMVQASVALFEYVLPVYKNEYTQLAKLYDDNAPQEQIQQSEQSIEQKYFAQFEALFNKLTDAGKLYAEKNSIKVQWDVQTSPR